MNAIIDFVHNKLGVDKICLDHAIDNPRSGKVMEKCGLKFHHYGEYSKTDGSQTFKAKFYTFKIPAVQLDNAALEVVDNQYRILTFLLFHAWQKESLIMTTKNISVKASALAEV